MGERTLFPNASTKATLAYCWSQMRPDRAAFAGCCGAIALGTLANAVAAPLIFAALLGRISDLGVDHVDLSSFTPLDRRLRLHTGGGDGLRPHRRLAELGRHTALLRSRHQPRLRPPHRTEPRLAHRPALGRGHRHARDVDVGLRGADRLHGVGHPEDLGHHAGRHRRAGHRGLAGGPGHGRARRCLRARPVPAAGPGGDGREGFLRRAFAGNRRGGRHHRQLDDRASPGGRGPREAARRSAGRRLHAGRPPGPPGLHDHADPDGVGHGLLQLGLRRRGHRPGAASRCCGRGRVPHPLLRHLRGNEPRGVLRVHPPHVAGHRALRQVRRHRPDRARHRRRAPGLGARRASWPGGVQPPSLRLPRRRAALRRARPVH